MRILLVCMGNICRSPTAEGVLRQRLIEHAAHLGAEVDSAGTHDYHVGEPPDRRAIAAAARRGIDLSGLRARQVADEDFEWADPSDPTTCNEDTVKFCGCESSPGAGLGWLTLAVALVARRRRG